MTETVTLGGRQFALRPPTLGQLRPLLDALADMAGKSGGALIDAAARVIAAGLAPANPGLTPDAVLDLEASIADLNEAVGTILNVAGLQPAEPSVGEARSPDGRPPVAAVPGMAISAPSTAPSPPAAVIPTL